MSDLHPNINLQCHFFVVVFCFLFCFVFFILECFRQFMAEFSREHSALKKETSGNWE